MIEWIRTETKEEAQERAGAILNAMLSEYQGRPVLLLCAGGSALSVLNYADPSLLHYNSLLCPSDERYSREEEASNSVALQASSFAKSAKVPVYSARPEEGESLEDASLRFSRILQDWQGPKVALLGIGKDGHITGIFPYPENPSLFTQLFEKGTVVGYAAEGKSKYPIRITPTLAFLRSIPFAVAYAEQEKRDALGRVKSEQGNLAVVPARVLHEMGEVKLVYV